MSERKLTLPPPGQYAEMTGGVHAPFECGGISVIALPRRKWTAATSLLNGCSRCIAIESNLAAYSRGTAGVPLTRAKELPAGWVNSVRLACDAFLRSRGLVEQVPQDRLIGTYDGEGVGL